MLVHRVPQPARLGAGGVQLALGLVLELGAQKDAAEESLETLYAEWETLAE